MLAEALIFVVAMPIVVASLVAVLLRSMRWAPPIVWAVATTLGYLAGQFGLESRAGLAAVFRSLRFPSDGRDWLAWIVLLALGVTILLNRAPRPARWWTYAIAALLAIAVPARLVAGHVRIDDWSAPERLFYLALLAGAFGTIWLLLAANRIAAHAWLRWALLVAVGLGAAMVITLSGALVNGRLSGVLAMSLSGAGTGLVAAATFLSGKSGPNRFASPFKGLDGSGGVFSLALGGLLLLAAFYAELSAPHAVMIVVSLLAAGVRLPAAVSRSIWLEASVRVPLCVVPTLLAIVELLGQSDSVYR